MIVYTREDVVKLSGTLMKNQWLTIKAAANLLLQDHREGIIIDCSELGHVSEEGALTFLDAMRDITAVGARIMVANLPDAVLKVLRNVPGVRSQLPIASSVEEARASFNLALSQGDSGSEKAESINPIIIPLIEGLDIEYAMHIAGRMARESRNRVCLIYFLEVARYLPIGSPLPEAEAEANKILENAAAIAHSMNLQISRRVERVRNIEDGLLNTLAHTSASHVVYCLSAQSLDDEAALTLVNVLLQRSPCEVIIGRQKRSGSNTEQDTANNVDK
jgi:anti-anti-sigma regulatory factor